MTSTCGRAAKRSQGWVASASAALLMPVALWSCSKGSDAGPAPAPQVLPRRAAAAPDEPVVVDAAVMAQQLDAAIAEARRTAGAARERWREEVLRARRDDGEGSGTSHAEGEGSSAWAIKWAAPVVAPIERGGLEHVWVRPTRWSGQRIEGVLLSTPRRDIGFVAGQAVSFPASELTDWLRDDGGSREGGFTIEVLERWSSR